MAAQKINEAHEHIAKAEKWWVKVKISIPFDLLQMELTDDKQATVLFYIKVISSE